jgi:hypothetical protein
MTMKEQSYVVTMRDCIGAMLLTSFVKFTYIAITITMTMKELSQFATDYVGLCYKFVKLN